MLSAYAPLRFSQPFSGIRICCPIILNRYTISAKRSELQNHYPNGVGCKGDSVKENGGILLFAFPE
jgi:hypothetical protein